MRPIYAALLGGLLALASPAAAEQIVHPEKGSALRAAVLDGARPIFQSETEGPIEMVVKQINVDGDWAFGDVFLQRPGGREIDWSKTKFGEANSQGAFDPGGSFFLVHLVGGRWNIVEYAIGPTDIAWADWGTNHNLPEALFYWPH